MRCSGNVECTCVAGVMRKEEVQRREKPDRHLTSTVCNHELLKSNLFLDKSIFA